MRPGSLLRIAAAVTEAAALAAEQEAIDNPSETNALEAVLARETADEAAEAAAEYADGSASC